MAAAEVADSEAETPAAAALDPEMVTVAAVEVARGGVMTEWGWEAGDLAEAEVWVVGEWAVAWEVVVWAAEDTVVRTVASEVEVMEGMRVTTEAAAVVDPLGVAAEAVVKRLPLRSVVNSYSTHHVKSVK